VQLIISAYTFIWCE